MTTIFTCKNCKFKSPEPLIMFDEGDFCSDTCRDEYVAKLKSRVIPRSQYRREWQEKYGTKEDI